MPSGRRDTSVDRIGYDPTTRTYHVRHSSEDEEIPLVVEIVEAVAAITGTEPMAMEPLYSVLDPDALELLIRDAGGDVQATFTYEGCRVTVESGGEIVVELGV